MYCSELSANYTSARISQVSTRSSCIHTKGTREEYINTFKKQMQNVFEMSDLGKLTYYLGIEVVEADDRIFINQSGHAKKVILMVGMSDCNSTKFPMEPKLHLTKDEEGNPVDGMTYRRIIGSLRYLIHKRPGLGYSVGVMSRFMESLKESHLKAVKQILRLVCNRKLRVFNIID
ncbi:uncharacterized mitochondrial protein AtMg00810-like [Rutidosis leptorrhynchoides]|uniref:uncharacterized mitochondrial protein AtMg00810-like n=1 Tax=Rutidosis leptorrhynchoides TaxID=125765 RepID=UPI003A9904A0